MLSRPLLHNCSNVTRGEERSRETPAPLNNDSERPLSKNSSDDAATVAETADRSQLPVARTSNEKTIKPPTNPITFVFTLINAKYQESVRYDASSRVIAIIGDVT